jgi:hypothetical protein
MDRIGNLGRWEPAIHDNNGYTFDHTGVNKLEVAILAK